MESGEVKPQEPTKPLTAMQKLPQYFTAAVVSFSSLGAGCAQGWTSPVLGRLQGITGSHEPLDHPLSPDEASWVSSLLTLGAIFGPIPCAILMDRFGRKPSIIALSCIPGIVGWLITLLATGPGALYAARAVIGTSMAASLGLGPVYIAETSSPSERGKLCSLPQLMITIGVMLQYSIGPFVSYHALAGMNLAFPILFMIPCAFLPESPYYLLAKGRNEEAEKALKWFRGGADVSSELNEMAGAIAESETKDSNLWESMKNVFETRGNRRAILITCGLMFFQQFSGIVAVLMNAESILRGSGEGEPAMEASTAAMVVGAVQIVASWAVTMLVDRAGRRILLILSCALSSISLFAFGAYSYLDVHSRASGLGWLPVTCLVIYILFYILGLGPLPWVAMSELFPNRAKSAASLLTSVFTCGAGFVVTRTFQPISSPEGPYVAYWLYASCSLAGAIFVALLLPETKGKTLEQIQRELAHR
ncbi:facilitated trehalose transporter Tret1-2 homolog [Ischnura elegans]|uniref:facilitated trehalose transporter Tret1-2 homolog n=1 Tax=Ischnura elegans TaxID=197161 RepID=UPI001ED88D9B|nr:facilitated trehalose transporter Tret1-2 homolog [Ischnura elegans]